LYQHFEITTILKTQYAYIENRGSGFQGKGKILLEGSKMMESIFQTNFASWKKLGLLFDWGSTNVLKIRPKNQGFVLFQFTMGLNGKIQVFEGNRVNSLPNISRPKRKGGNFRLHQKGRCIIDEVRGQFGGHGWDMEVFCCVDYPFWQEG